MVKDSLFNKACLYNNLNVFVLWFLSINGIMNGLMTYILSVKLY